MIINLKEETLYILGTAVSNSYTDDLVMDILYVFY